MGTINCKCNQNAIEDTKVQDMRKSKGIKFEKKGLLQNKSKTGKEALFSPKKIKKSTTMFSSKLEESSEKETNVNRNIYNPNNLDSNLTNSIGIPKRQKSNNSLSLPIITIQLVGVFGSKGAGKKSLIKNLKNINRKNDNNIIISESNINYVTIRKKINNKEFGYKFIDDYNYSLNNDNKLDYLFYLVVYDTSLLDSFNYAVTFVKNKSNKTSKIIIIANLFKGKKRVDINSDDFDYLRTKFNDQMYEIDIENSFDFNTKFENLIIALSNM